MRGAVFQLRLFFCKNDYIYGMDEAELLKKDISRVEENSKQWWKEVKDDVRDIKDSINELPDAITKRINETVDLKIKNAINESNSALYKWIAGLAISTLVSLSLAIMSLVTKGN